MTLDETLLKKCTAKAEQVILMEQQAEQAKIEYHAEIRRLHLKGGSYREIAAALGLSHQRISQIVNGESPNWLTRWTSKSDDPRTGLLNCSFCGQSQTQVNKLVRGPKVFICDVCVDHSLALFSDTELKDKRAFMSLRDSDTAYCSFCGRLQKEGKRRFVGNEKNRICTECIAIAEASLNREWVEGQWKYHYKDGASDVRS